jgi:hypothetical protein
MANPFSGLQNKLSTLRHRPWQKDISILVLALLLVAVSGYAFREPLSAAFARARAGAAGGETVSVFDVVVDRENR